ncbi:hypothetical protein [Chitinophaga sp. MD30]|uniref:hypothetical protein n=1 Tax=Chitinophaga sp. MD30 TaxID=2033437 RepID=UPI000BAFB530|nr:hypothetical protein [Chitinophaga sp. MD30]ASZ14484.1 hypothetical protein CK934_27835 [Chitinophaga sp. MD30]
MKTATLLVVNKPISSIWLWQDMLVILSMYLTLFHLRIADEIKDYDYDKVHNPDRPLVQRLVSPRDLGSYMIVLAVITASINLYLQQMLGLIILADFVYGYLLIFIEKRWPKLADNIYINLLITYPVNILLSVYITFYTYQQYQINWRDTYWFSVGGFALGFLFYEFARKTRWPELAKESARIYSRELGGVATAMLTLLFGLLAPVVVMIGVISSRSFHPLLLLMYVCWIPAIYGVSQFLRQRNGEPIKHGLWYLGLFYGSLIVLQCLLL